MFRVAKSGRRKRFPLAAYNRLKKQKLQELVLAQVEKDEKVRERRSKLDKKATELEAFTKPKNSFEDGSESFVLITLYSPLAASH